MRIAKIIENDIVNGEGVCVSLFTQGCPHRCEGCFNPETWWFTGGIEVSEKWVFNELCKAISANGLQRNLSILGGEPLCPDNIQSVKMIIKMIKEKYPTIKIFLWTGYIIENFNNEQKEVAKLVDVLIDGPYIKELRDVSLPLRGSSNQRVLRNELTLK